MCGRLIILAILFLSLASPAARKVTRLTPFQKNIQNCLQDQIEVKNLTSLSKVYATVSERYLLVSSEILNREVVYKIKNENRKLRLENGKVQLFKILEEEDDRAVLIDNELRQKNLTTESFLAQLLIHADIRSDWMKLGEKRSGSTSVVMTTLDGEIKSLQIERAKIKKKLDCNRTDAIDSCSCSDLK